MVRKSFGETLRSFREAKGWTQARLESAAGCPETWCSRTETGKTRPPNRQICDQIAEVLECDPEALFGAAIFERHGDEWFEILLAQKARKDAMLARPEIQGYLRTLRLLLTSENPRHVTVAKRYLRAVQKLNELPLDIQAGALKSHALVLNIVADLAARPAD